jgi:hypothetical protein
MYENHKYIQTINFFNPSLKPRKSNILRINYLNGYITKFRLTLLVCLILYEKLFVQVKITVSLTSKEFMMQEKLFTYMKFVNFRYLEF